MGTQRGLHSQVIVLLALVPCILCAGCRYPGVVRFSAVESGEVVLDDAGRQAVFPKTGLRLSLVQNRVTVDPVAPPWGVLVVAVENVGAYPLRLSRRSLIIQDGRWEVVSAQAESAGELPPYGFPGSEITLGPNERLELRFGLTGTLPRSMFVTYWQNGVRHEALLWLRIQGSGLLNSDVVYYGG